MATKPDSTVGKVRNLGLIDLDTGEILQKNVYVIGKHGEVDTGYVKVFITFLSDVISDKEITGKAIRLLLYMIEKLEWNSLRIILIPKEAISDLKVHEKTFYEWLKILKDKNIITRIAPNVYELNVNTFIKGSLAKTIKKKKDSERNIKKKKGLEKKVVI